jgi:hypothetical protein
MAKNQTPTSFPISRMCCALSARETGFSPGGLVLPAIVDNGHVLSATDPDPAEWGGNCCNISMVL